MKYRSGLVWGAIVGATTAINILGLKEQVMKHNSSRIVLGSDLNHHGTLFAGQMAKWVVEACLIHATKLCGKADDLVCVNIQNLTFKYPVQKGEVIDIESSVERLGTTSLTIGARVSTSKTVLETAITFVTLNKDGRPVAHELVDTGS